MSWVVQKVNQIKKKAGGRKIVFLNSLHRVKVIVLLVGKSVEAIGYVCDKGCCIWKAI